MNLNNFFTISTFLLLLYVPIYSQQLRLNEIMSSNNATIADEDGEYNDWLEILNISDDPVSLSGYGLSDSDDNYFKWIFPDTVIGPGKLLLVWASGKNRRNRGGALHCNFSIDADGENIFLTTPDWAYRDQLKPVSIPADYSIGRVDSANVNWMFFSEPTPGALNTTKPYYGRLSPPTFSHSPGFYKNSINLSISHQDKNVQLRYTTDGSDPSETSPCYKTSLTINDRSNEKNRLSEIPTNRLVGTTGWKPPQGSVAKGTIVRVAAFKPGYLASKSLSGTFFIFPEGNARYTLPVVSIIVNEKSFFDDTVGIYVPGLLNINENAGTGNYQGRGDNWEREGNLEYFNTHGALQLSQLASFSIHGGYSRRLPSKGLNVCARSSYGDPYFNTRFFPELPYSKYKNIILRQSGNDFTYSMFCDAAAQIAVRHLNFDTQAYSPSIVFINGEYWGIKNIREKYDKHYIERVYGVDPENIDLLSNTNVVKEGSIHRYKEMCNLIKSHHLSDSSMYTTASTYMDICNFIDYYSSQIYFANTDWPQNNIDCWRLRSADSADSRPGHDGRFRWLMYDVDRAFGRAPYTTNMLLHVTDTSRPNSELIVNLLNNPTFKKEFINRQADLLNTTFRNNRISSIVDSIAGIVEPEITEHIRRWNHPSDISVWKRNVRYMRLFAQRRPPVLRSHIMDYFNLKDTCHLTLLTNNAHGAIKINSLLINKNLTGSEGAPFPWNGVYFKGNSVICKPVPDNGYRFDYWRVNGQIHNETVLVIDPEDDLKIEAVFTSQKIIHYFHFNSIQQHIDKEDNIHTLSSDYSDTSEAILQYSGSGSGYMDDVSGTLENIVAGEMAGRALRVRNPSNTRSLILSLPTKHFRNITFSYAVCRTNSGATQQSLYYSTTDNPSEWKLYSSAIEIHEPFETKTFDFSKITVVNDNPFFKVKITFDTNADGLKGNNRFDNILVCGTHITEEQTPPDVQKPQQDDLTLMQNNPNPLNKNTQIVFRINTTSYVRLVIYDMRGRLIRTLVNGEQQAGLYRITWETNMVPSGLYIYRLENQGKNFVRKMMLKK